MTTTTRHRVQLDADESALTTRVRLVPPLSPGLSVYGGEDTAERARRWALEHRLLLVQGVSACPHGLYGMGSCPGDCRALGDLDHADLWYGHEGPGNLFLLAHPYADEVPAGARALAAAHGLTVESDPWDRWYSESTVPVRLTAPGHLHVWPLTTRCLLLATLLPVRWPTDPDATR